jgi:hypothetical protein
MAGRLCPKQPLAAWLFFEYYMVLRMVYGHDWIHVLWILLSITFWDTGGNEHFLLAGWPLAPFGKDVVLKFVFQWFRWFQDVSVVSDGFKWFY